jgi:hypothetical protein
LKACTKASDNFIDDSDANDLESVYDDDGEEVSVIIYDLIEQLKDPDDASPFKMALYATDISCIEREFEKYELTDLLPEIRHLLMESSFDEVRGFMNVVTMCSSRMSEILERKFDQLVSESGPTAIIRNDRRYGVFRLNLRCFKDYAINHELMNVDISYTMTNEPEKDCEEVIESFHDDFLKERVKHLNSERTKCLNEVYNFEKTTLKNLLMIELHLTKEDLAKERKLFIVNARKDHEKLLSCIKTKTVIFHLFFAIICGLKQFFIFFQHLRLWARTDAGTPKNDFD